MNTMNEQESILFELTNVIAMSTAATVAPLPQKHYEDLTLEVLKIILLRSAALMLTDFQTVSSS